MKIVFFGITDMRRDREAEDGSIYGYGVGYVRVIADRLCDAAQKYEIFNRGIGGDRSVDLYARIKRDVWNLNPDAVSILVGINDIWHERYGNGVEITRYEKALENILTETGDRLPNAKIMLCEPFVLHGREVDAFGFEKLDKIREYAEVVKNLAEKYGVTFIPLQKALDEAAMVYGASNVLYDGIHPAVYGAKIIADEWLKNFINLQKEEKIK